jgi:hypothetical protein
MNTSTTAYHSTYDRSAYERYIDRVATAFHQIVTDGAQLFVADTHNLFEVYLNSFSQVDRQFHNCDTCRRFIQTYGSIVTISADGKRHSPIWETIPAPPHYAVAVANMVSAIDRAPIKGVFLSETADLGLRQTGAWSHYALKLPETSICRDLIRSATQITAEKLEDFRMLRRYLPAYSEQTIAQVLTLLDSDALYRSEACLGRAKWHYALKQQVERTTSERVRENLIWLAVATAPPGFCHISSSMLGTLLDDIQSGMDFESVSRRFAEKMRPDRYLRPTAAPTLGNIERAEQIIERLGIADSLQRRYARIEELELLWSPTASTPVTPTAGIFGHLRERAENRSSQSLDTPPITMTFEKFVRKVLPDALAIDYWLTDTKQSFAGILTAAVADAPLIFQWDNPFSWYVWVGGSTPKTWKLPSNGWHRVTGITYQPSMWGKPLTHKGQSAIFILEGACETNENRGLGLFPEFLGAHLHEVRSTIEAHSRQGNSEDPDKGTANGIMLSGGKDFGTQYRFRVRTSLGTSVYQIDRWD